MIWSSRKLANNKCLKWLLTRVGKSNGYFIFRSNISTEFINNQTLLISKTALNYYNIAKYDENNIYDMWKV